MSKLSAGTYEATVVGSSLELIGEKNYPVLKVKFKPTKYRNGSVFVDGDYPGVDKLYFLSDELATKGPKAGQNKIEILRDELKDTFDYTGSLQPQALEALIGKSAEIVVEMNANGYPQTKWVNKLGGGSRKAGKALPAEILAKLNSKFLGQAAATTQADPNDFFLRLANGG